MPELNNDAPEAAVPHTAFPDTALPDSEVPDAAWPELTVPGRGPEAGIADPAVLAIVDRVRAVPGLPVSEHPAAYAEMHDALLEALNEDPPNEALQHQDPRHGPGAA